MHIGSMMRRKKMEEIERKKERKSPSRGGGGVLTYIDKFRMMSLLLYLIKNLIHKLLAQLKQRPISTHSSYFVIQVFFPCNLLLSEDQTLPRSLYHRSPQCLST